MTNTLDIWTLPPAELRGYARGLRETASLLHSAWNPVADGAQQECNVLVDATHASWVREAHLVDGFAARLEAQAPTTTKKPALYWPPGIDRREAVPDIEDALHLIGYLPTLEPAPLRSTAWPGTRWVVRVPISEDGETDIEIFETQEEAMALIADWPRCQEDATPEEATQSGLADQVAEQMATQAEANPPSAATSFRVLPATEPPPAADQVTEASAEPAAEPPPAPRTTMATPADDPTTPWSPVWTEARLALLCAEFPTADLDDLFRRVNAIKGPSPCASRASMEQKAFKLGLRRANSLAAGHPQTTRDEARRLYEIEHVSASQIAKRLSLPVGTVSGWIGKYGWQMQETETPEPEADPPPEPPAPAAPTPLAEPLKPTPTMLPEDAAEAREKLRTGEFKGAKGIKDYYGCTPEEAQALVDAHRARMGKAA